MSWGNSTSVSRDIKACAHVEGRPNDPTLVIQVLYSGTGSLVEIRSPLKSFCADVMSGIAFACGITISLDPSYEMNAADKLHARCEPEGKSKSAERKARDKKVGYEVHHRRFVGDQEVTDGRRYWFAPSVAQTVFKGIEQQQACRLYAMYLAAQETYEGTDVILTEAVEI